MVRPHVLSHACGGGDWNKQRDNTNILDVLAELGSSSSRGGASVGALGDTEAGHRLRMGMVFMMGGTWL